MGLLTTSSLSNTLHLLEKGSTKQKRCSKIMVCKMVRGLL